MHTYLKHKMDLITYIIIGIITNGTQLANTSTPGTVEVAEGSTPVIDIGMLLL